jgi:sulfur transfer protein SufE
MQNMTLFESCLAKQKSITTLFSDCYTPQRKYEKLIELGRLLPSYPIELKTPNRLVKGCQSEMYLDASLLDGKVHFKIHSDALISAGLGAMLLAVYNHEPPEAILSCPPQFLNELGIQEALSPSRSNGLSSLFLRMKQEALKFLVNK